MTKFERNNRMKCERLIVERVIDDALKAGYVLTVNDGEDNVLINSRNKAAILEAMFSTDEDVLFLRRPIGDDKTIAGGWVRFIYGNDGPDVMSDYTVNLEALLKGANNLADTIEERGL